MLNAGLDSTTKVESIVEDVVSFEFGEICMLSVYKAS